MLRKPESTQTESTQASVALPMALYKYVYDYGYETCAKAGRNCYGT